MITYDDAKTWLGLEDDSDQALIENFLVPYVEESIETYIDNKINQTTISGEVLSINQTTNDLQRNPSLDLRGRELTVNTRYYPILSITSLINDGSVLIEDQDYTYEPTLGRIIFYRGISDCKDKLTITYSAGYSTCPSDLKMVALELVKWMYQQHGASKGEGDIQSKRLREFSVTYRDNTRGQTTGGSLLTRINEFDYILDKYKNIGI